MNPVELMRTVPDALTLEALRDALFDAVCLLVGLPKEGEPPQVQVVGQVEGGTRSLGLSVFVPEVSRGLVEGPDRATLEAMSRIAHEVAVRRWGGSAEVLLFCPPTLGELDGATPVDCEVLRVQRRQAVPELIGRTMQDWLELIAEDEGDVSLRWRFDEGGHLEIFASIADPDERILLEPTGPIPRALGHLTGRLGEALGVRARLTLRRPGR